MAENSSSSSLKSFTWWFNDGNYDEDDIELGGMQSPRPSSVCSNDHSMRSGSMATLSGITTPTMTPTTMRHVMPKHSGIESPEVRHKLEKASPGTTRQIALRMYDSMKRNGLSDEASKALSQKDEHNDDHDYGIQVVTDDGVRKRREELMGMDYLLKDGFVSYLRDMARITPPIPQQVVRFSNVRYATKVEVSDNEYETFGSKLVDCFMGPLNTVFKSKTSSWLQILKGVDGYIMPGSMTLLLGPPGSGKSTLLGILAGRVKASRSSMLQCRVMYNDKNASDICRSRLIAYISGQLNKHIPFLSVRETLEFARDCTQGLRPENFTPQMRKFFAHALVEGQDPFLEYVLEILGLKQIEDKLTLEISDIDRQKLTTAELALGTFSVMFYDQPLSGSDLAATYDLVDTLRAISRIQQSSAVMSLTQLSQQVFDLFDRVILLCDGKVLFQGPRQDAIPYFANLGYIKPSHVESSEFLEDIVAGFGSQYIAPGAAAYTLEELVECYRASDHYKDVMRIVHGGEVKHTCWVESEPGLLLSLKTPSKYHCSVDDHPRKETELVVAKLSTKVGHSGGIESTGRVHIGDVVTAISINNDETQYLSVGPHKVQHLRASHAYLILKQAQGRVCLQVERYKEEADEHQAQLEQFQRTYIQTWWKSTRTLMNRQIKITRTLHHLIKLRLFQAIVLGLFSGTLFYKLGGQYNQQKMNSVRALGFVSTMSVMLSNLVQLPLYMLQRPMFYKHRAQRFFRTSSYVVAHCMVNLPQTLIEALVYTISVHFLAGLSLAGNGAPFFEYMVLLFLVAYFGSSVFFFLGTISSIPEAGNALAGLLVSIFLLFSGFVIYPSNIPTYWKWLLYINPIHWANVSFCRIQFNKGYIESCSNYLGQLPFCDQFPTVTVGNAYLAFYELSGDAKRTWLPYAILLAWIVITSLLTLLGLKKIQFAETCQSLPHLKNSPAIGRYKEGKKSEFQTNSSCDEQSADYDSPRHYEQHTPRTAYNKMKDNVGDKWPHELHDDLERGGLGIPVEPVTLIFEDLSFSRPEEQFSNCSSSARIGLVYSNKTTDSCNRDDEETKQSISIFNYVTGYTRSRNMLGLIGGSKRSKATLMECLAGRKPLAAGSFRGNIQLHSSKTSTTFSRLIGYVEKLDAHQPYLSVRESLQFSAALRLDQAISPMNRCIHVEQVLNQLGLLPYSNKLVGSLRDATGKTYEIAKKITIAVELATNPSVLLLEEPISGLDATGALTILKTLSQVSDSGRAIIASLSHPTARVLSFFHQALILTKEGDQAYFGPVGPNCHQLLDYFASIPEAPRYSRRESPIMFVMETLGLGVKKRHTQLLNFAEAYQASSLHEISRKEISDIRNSMQNSLQNDKSSAYTAPYSQQALLVLLRTQRFLWRNVHYTYGRLMGCMIIGLLMGSLYFQIEFKDTYGVTSRSLYIYVQVILIGVISANNVIPQLGTDKFTYLREKRAGMYLPIFYPISWAVGEIPYFCFATLVVVGIGNAMAGIGTRSSTEFLMYWLVLFLFTLCVTYFGMMIAFLAPVPTLAAFAVSILTSLWVSASGVVVVLSDIKFYRWMYWTNPFQYAMNALTSISFYCAKGECTEDCKCPKLPDGSDVWERLATVRSLSHERIDTDILILTTMCVLFAVVAFIFFAVLKHNSRPHL
ncbi:ABC transporter, G [Parasponia andersonii]|uniref:ABC transporter, G n=1 Tax=Parasponia andersonii TaxID=3476 RepID=A0A2P5D8H6_PARAD|nr:ABC transporter, G [Parasponia andersonii]